jgi:hypothetical protein
LDAEKLKKMAIDAGFSRAMAWYSVRLFDFRCFLSRLLLLAIGKASK